LPNITEKCSEFPLLADGFPLFAGFKSQILSVQSPFKVSEGRMGAMMAGGFVEKWLCYQ